MLGWRDINQLARRRQYPSVRAGFPYLQYINWGSNDAHSNYNSLQMTLTQRVSHGLSFIGGYTYAHGLDNGSLNRFGLLPQNSADPGAEYASSDFDIRQRFTLTASYNLPGQEGLWPVARRLADQWHRERADCPAVGRLTIPRNNFSGTGEITDRWDFFGSPSAFQVRRRIRFPTVPASGRATITCSQTNQFGTFNLPSSLGAKCTAVAPDPTTLATGGCYVVGNSVMVPPVAGTFGTMGRNIFRDSGFKNLDFSLFKNFTFRERFGAQFRAEVFNLLNHPTFANPYGASNGYLGGSDPSSPGTFGFAGTTPDVAAGNPLIGSGSARVIQLGLKLMLLIKLAGAGKNVPSHRPACSSSEQITLRAQPTWEPYPNVRYAFIGLNLCEWLPLGDWTRYFVASKCRSGAQKRFDLCNQFLRHLLRQEVPSGKRLATYFGGAAAPRLQDIVHAMKRPLLGPEDQKRALDFLALVRIVQQIDGCGRAVIFTDGVN